MTKCKNCNSGWELQEGEHYCGWCAAGIYEFKLKVESELIYVDSENSNKVYISILNTGQLPISIDEIKVEDIT